MNRENLRETTKCFLQSSEAYPQSSEAYPPPPPPPKLLPPPPPPPPEMHVFKYPFTMIVSGPTFCGKTFFLKKLLQNAGTACNPHPQQRIVWLYKRWQPLNDVIKATVVPEVEFIQGIPCDLEQDHYFDPAIRNLIVIDDLMTLSAKDTRINDLLTEGSHHRNLSVVALNQNLYFGRDPTQTRNCHYLALFNNPIDKQPIMTLARQMYPGNTQYFIDRFQKSVVKPYGHLLVDLKPTTAEKR